MDLFIKIYIKNYKDLFQRTPINPFEKKSLIILIVLGFIHIGTSILYISLSGISAGCKCLSNSLE